MNIENNISVSTVTPVYCGEEYLVGLCEELKDLKSSWEQSDTPFYLTESIFVDDGSVDGSSMLLAQLQDEHDFIRIVTLSKNFGQHAATVAGICHTSSDWVVTLDEDLQHQPKVINEMFKLQSENRSDVIYAKPLSGVHGDNWRDKTSRIAKKVLAKLTSTPQVREFNSFRLIRGSIARAAASSSSSSTYLDIAISWFSKSYASLHVQMQDDRYVDHKNSGYTLYKLIAHGRRLVVSSQIDIASWGIFTGVISILIAIVIAATVLAQRLFMPEIVESAGWASIMASIAFFGGVIVAVLCIALEYINVVVQNQLGRPSFFIVDRSKDDLIQKWTNSKSK